ncbi:D-isomer specific 2-hydroxyacid dehydrogenase [Aspergillus carlsbadensis]|nr:D-isomer specific 2-hydroxyacid dehydrogenase [Aspergillus carlsbadensis]
MRHHIVFLEAACAPSPQFTFPHTCERFDTTSPDQVPTRIANATIKLQCVALTATGVTWLDRRLFAERGITVVNCPQANVDAVAEHSVALYFAVRRKIVEQHLAVTGPENAWIRDGQLTARWVHGPPLGCRQEVLGIIGYGALGRRIEQLARGLGFGKVLAAEHKGEAAREGRVLFEDVLRTATTIVLCCPKDDSTVGLISQDELSMMRPEVILVNVARGAIVCERALADALRQHRIAGAATDVLVCEPGGISTSPLIPDVENGEAAVPNLTITSHLAWFSAQTMENLCRMLKGSIEGFVMGNLLSASPDTVVVHEGVIHR